ncbi:tumor necrosis factor ligand superfamily member 13 isoform X2 [Engraulis encrasicolus]|uniref:tumor necrosis factor ligand superfamily member 13 isoform X2 n=1 Tax=Engraulis encrasicolus TaxID=184585 RepID=UPI002FD3B3CC
MVQRVRGTAVGCSGSCATTPVFLFAVSLTTFCICVCVLFFQAGQISELKSELMNLKTKVETADMSGHAACCWVWGCYRDTTGQSLNRVRREASKRGRQRRQNRKNRTLLHLQALSSHSQDEEDRTVIKWTPAWSQGEGLLVSGETVTVVTEGPYFLYSQVLYRSTTWIMGQVIIKRLNGTDTKLLKCVKHMPTDDNNNPLNSCYTAGVFFLESGAVLELSIPRRSASLILTPYSTFLGMHSLW